MKILVTGPESSGTKMVAHILTKAGADVLHYTPRLSRGDTFLDGTDYDHTVIVVRNGMANTQSMLENSHATHLAEAEEQMLDELFFILGSLAVPASQITLVTYESLLKPEAVKALCAKLRLETEFEYDTVKDANSKYFGGEYFEDRRGLPARGVQQTPQEYYAT